MWNFCLRYVITSVIAEIPACAGSILILVVLILILVANLQAQKIWIDVRPCAQGATFSIRGQLSWRIWRRKEKLLRTCECVRNFKISSVYAEKLRNTGWRNRRTLRRLQDVKPRKKRISNPCFEQALKLNGNSLLVSYNFLSTCKSTIMRAKTFFSTGKARSKWCRVSRKKREGELEKM